MIFFDSAPWIGGRFRLWHEWFGSNLVKGWRSTSTPTFCHLGHSTRIKKVLLRERGERLLVLLLRGYAMLCLSSFSIHLKVLRHTDPGSQGQQKKAMLGQFHPKNIEGFHCFQAPLTQQIGAQNIHGMFQSKTSAYFLHMESHTKMAHAAFNRCGE